MAYLLGHFGGSVCVSARRHDAKAACFHAILICATRPVSASVFARQHKDVAACEPSR